MDRILVPVDGSPLSRRAFEIAIEEHPEAELVALHVVDPTEPGYSVVGREDADELEPRRGSAEWYDRARELADELFAELAEFASGTGVELTTETVVGRADREIVDHAVGSDADAIFLGSHGRSADAHLLGSVTEAVAFRAPVRVCLVR